MYSSDGVSFIANILYLILPLAVLIVFLRLENREKPANMVRVLDDLVNIAPIGSDLVATVLIREFFNQHCT